FVAKYGRGVQHIGFRVPNGAAAALPLLLKNGGVQTVNRPVVVDMRSKFKLEVEVMDARPAASAVGPNDRKPSNPETLGGSTVTHVGVVVPNIEQAVKAYAAFSALLRRRLKPSRSILHRGFSGDAKADAKVAMVPTSGVSV